MNDEGYTLDFNGLIIVNVYCISGGDFQINT